MALFFDADWFDQRLAARGTDRIGLAVAAGIERGELHSIFTNERSPTAAEIAEFARVLEIDLLEATIRSGVAVREVRAGRRYRRSHREHRGAARRDRHMAG